MDNTMTIKCTFEEWQTIYTALRMEKVRNQENPDATQKLMRALKAVQSAE